MEANDTNLSTVQKEIYKVLEKWSEKALFTESALAKQIRFNTKLEGKNKAALSFRDIEEAIFALASVEQKYFSLHANSANDLLIKKSNTAKGLDDDARKRRQASEKSMSILTAADFTKRSNNSKKGALKKLRTKRESINIYSDYEEL